jgi:hypothetical protein
MDYFQAMIRPAPPAPFKTAFLTFLIAAIIALLVAGKADARDANWKLLVTIDYTSTATATDSYCFPHPDQSAPSTLTATVTRKVTLRTVKPTSIQMYQAPSGTPATIRVGPPYKAQVTETRAPGLDTSGRPAGCFSIGPAPKYDCGTHLVRSGGYVSPLVRSGAWKGFTFESEQRPSFESCGVAPAEAELPDPYDALELRASPAALTGHAPKLVFHRTRTFKASKNSGSLRSSATAKFSYTVTLIHR